MNQFSVERCMIQALYEVKIIHNPAANSTETKTLFTGMYYGTPQQVVDIAKKDYSGEDKNKDDIVVSLRLIDGA